jgi:hypothetical protein
MKRSKIFLSTITCILAIAGVMATKTNLRGINATYYTGNGICKEVKLQACTILNTGIRCMYVTTGGTRFPLYTAVLPCIHPVYYGPL